MRKSTHLDDVYADGTVMNMETWRIIFLWGAIQGAILAGALVVNRRGPKTANYLLSTMLASSGLVLTPWIFAMYGRFGAAGVLMWYVAGPVAASAGPLFYFYVRAFLTPDRRYSPALIIVTALGPELLRNVVLLVKGFGIEGIANTMQKLIAGNILTVSPSSLVLPVAITVYRMVFFWLAYRVIKQVRTALKDDYSTERRHHEWWLRVLMAGVLLLTVQPIFIWVIMYVSHEYSFWIEAAVLLPRCIFIHTVAIAAFLLPEGFIKTYQQMVVTSRRQSLDHSVAEREILRVREFMQTDKPYREDGLRLADLADKLSIPAHVLSQLINDQLHVNYFDFVNKYRVEEAKAILRNPDSDEYTLIAIARDAGFKCKASFNRAFKKHAGMSPSQYRAAHRVGKAGGLRMDRCLDTPL